MQSDSFNSCYYLHILTKQKSLNLNITKKRLYEDFEHDFKLNKIDHIPQVLYLSETSFQNKVNSNLMLHFCGVLHFSTFGSNYMVVSLQFVVLAIFYKNLNSSSLFSIHLKTIDLKFCWKSY